ncbi:cell division/cell wall cluster transcriptional repressor MraZ [Candidatus Roizmanbacteria bacterium]|nr:cell division/cell wall cluster transcriptional repressor MraZ [Candidatus Roizmanbacteria bacterium]
MVFFGEYEVSFSGIGRIVLPKKIRALLKGNIFILAKGSINCLAGYDRENWEKRTQELLQSSLLEDSNADKKRFVFSSIVYPEIDDQGRFVIPKNLLKHAGLNNKATIIGVGDHFEIWEPQKWNAYLKQIHPQAIVPLGSGQARKL